MSHLKYSPGGEYSYFSLYITYLTKTTCGLFLVRYLVVLIRFYNDLPLKHKSAYSDNLLQINKNIEELSLPLFEFFPQATMIQRIHYLVVYCIFSTGTFLENI